MKPTVALCMIVRNEQSTLPRCLDSAAGVVDAVYVTDTGSTDATVEIAQRFGAIVRRFTWCDDFSAARNFSIQDVPADWILVMDADDLFPDGEARRLRSTLQKTEALTATLDYVVEAGFTPVPTRRLLRNGCGLQFTGIIHESINPASFANRPGHTLHTGVKLFHTGYAQGAKSEKVRRNLPLLLREMERCRTEADEWRYLVIARELGWTWLQFGERNRGENVLKSALEVACRNEQGGASGLEILAALYWHLQATGRAEEGWQVCQALAGRWGELPGFALYQGIAAFQTGRFPEALDALRRFELQWQSGAVAMPIPATYTSTGLWDMEGQCCLNLGRSAEAVSLFAKCLASEVDSPEYAAKLKLARRIAGS